MPGQRFLRANPQPSGQLWKGKDYWRRALSDLIAAYRGICAYSASWTKRASEKSTPQDSSIDHFIPRSAGPGGAYEWSNFRLSRSRINSLKGDHQDVIDPFSLAAGWFQLDFRTFRLVPNPSLPQGDRVRVLNTIARLGLNSDQDYVKERVRAIRAYCVGAATLEQLRRRYPFIAQEMDSQNFDAIYLARMKAHFSAVNP